MSDDQTIRYSVETDAIVGIIVGCLISLPVWLLLIRWLL